MTEETYENRINKRTREEYQAFERDPVARAQRTLDFFWQARLDAGAAARRRIERPSAVDAGSGLYDPMRRFESEG